MFKNALVYRITQWEAPALAALQDRLTAQRFAECGASQQESAGWVEPRGERHDALAGGVVLRPLQTAQSPATAMSTWLATRAAPAGFTVDRDCELKQPDGEKASVRYARHTLEIDEIAAHVGQGKVPTQVALTWN